MAIRPLKELDDYQLTNSDQDCRGWSVVDPAGNHVGTVNEMLVDTDAERVTSLVLESGDVIPVESVSLRDGQVQARMTPVGGDELVPGAAKPAFAGSTVKAGDEVVLPVIEEDIRIGKREVAGGGVRVTTRVEERPVHETVSLREEQVHVERRPADRAVASADEAFEERSFEVGARSEEAVVDKQARVVEEVVVDKKVRDREAVIDEKVKRTDVDVTDLGAGKDGSSRPS
jgi:uncharacterized protein (TIGR02271 family)